MVRACAKRIAARGIRRLKIECETRLPGCTTLMTLAANPRSLVFYMAYPGPGNLDGASRSLIDGAYLLKALDQTLADKGFGAIELTSFKSKTLQKEVAKRVKASNKKVAFHCEPVQWTNEENLIDPADLS